MRLLSITTSILRRIKLPQRTQRTQRQKRGNTSVISVGSVVNTLFGEFAQVLFEHILVHHDVHHLELHIVFVHEVETEVLAFLAAVT